MDLKTSRLYQSTISNNDMNIEAKYSNTATIDDAQLEYYCHVYWNVVVYVCDPPLHHSNFYIALYFHHISRANKTLYILWVSSVLLVWRLIRMCRNWNVNSIDLC